MFQVTADNKPTKLDEAIDANKIYEKKQGELRLLGEDLMAKERDLEALEKRVKALKKSVDDTKYEMFGIMKALKKDDFETEDFTLKTTAKHHVSCNVEDQGDFYHNFIESGLLSSDAYDRLRRVNTQTTGKHLREFFREKTGKEISDVTADEISSFQKEFDFFKYFRKNSVKVTRK